MRILPFLVIGFSLRAEALDVSLVAKKDESTIIFNHVEVPREQLKAHLKSGLHNNFIFDAIVTKNSKILFKQTKTWKVFYDLWDDTFRVTDTDQESATQLEYKTLEAFFLALENPTFTDGRNASERDPLADKEALFGVRVVLNPVSEETVARINKWVYQRRVPTSANIMVTQAPGGSASSSPHFQSLFTQILGYEMNNAAKTALWTYEATAQLSTIEVKK